MVEQFGLAMMKSSSVKRSPLISGMINFLSSSILKAEELSTTRQPIAANFGAHSRDIFPPAEKSATSGFMFNAFSTSTTVCSCPPNRSEEHTSELQSRPHLVCRLLLEKKKVLTTYVNA